MKHQLVLQAQRNKLDARMMRSVWQATRDADALLAIVDASTDPGQTLESLNQIFEARESRNLPLALVRSHGCLVCTNFVIDAPITGYADATGAGELCTSFSVGSSILFVSVR